MRTDLQAIEESYPNDYLQSRLNLGSDKMCQFF